MVDLLTMDRTAKMLVQGGQGAKAALTEVASITGPIPRSGSGKLGGSGIVVVPADLLVGEDMIWVDFAAVLVDFGAIDARRAAT